MDIYESDYFGMYCLCGSILLVGMTGDLLWLPIGLGAFLYTLFTRGKF